MKLESNGIIIDLGENPVRFIDSGPVKNVLPKTAVTEVADEILDNEKTKGEKIGAAVKHLLPLILKYAGAGQYTPIVMAIEKISEEVIERRIANKESPKAIRRKRKTHRRKK